MIFELTRGYQSVRVARIWVQGSNFDVNTKLQKIYNAMLYFYFFITFYLFCSYFFSFCLYEKWKFILDSKFLIGHDMKEDLSPQLTTYFKLTYILYISTQNKWFLHPPFARLNGIFKYYSKKKTKSTYSDKLHH